MALDFTSLIQTWQGFENSVEPTNPLGIQTSAFAYSQGAIGANGSQAVFPTLDQGMSATNALLNSSGYSGLTLGQAINRWVTGSSDTTAPYADAFAAKGFDLSQPLSSFAGGAGGTGTMADQIEGTSGMAGTLGTGSASGATASVANAGNWFTANVGRWGSLALGLICIAAGLMLFKPVHDTVISTAKTAAKVAA